MFIDFARCDDPVQRIEQSALGTVFICTYGAPKHTFAGCRRTYLSQRDLDSHIHHRHLKKSEPAKSSSDKTHHHTPFISTGHQVMTSTGHQVMASTGHQMMTSTGHQMMMSTSHQIVSSASHHAVMSSSHQPLDVQQHTNPSIPPRQMVDQGVFRPLDGNPLVQPHVSVPGLVPQMAVSHAQIHQPPPQTLQVSVPQGMSGVMTTIESYQTSSIPVMAGSRTNLITVPIQEGSNVDKYQTNFVPGSVYPSHLANTLPPAGFAGVPPPGMPPSHIAPIRQAFPPSTMAAAAMHQVAPSSYGQPISQGPTMFSSSTIPLSVGHPQHPVPVCRAHTGPPGSLQHQIPGSVLTPMSNAPTGHLSGPPSLVGIPGPQGPRQQSQPPPRFPSPHGHFDDGLGQPFNQPGSPRMHWTGPQTRGPPPVSGGGAPMQHPPQQRPQGDSGPFGQYY